MLSKALGIISIITGLWWLIRPEALQNRLKRKMNRKLKFTVYMFIIIFGFLLIGSVLGARGILPKVVGIIGMVITIKGILLITSKTSEKISDWLAGKPLQFFRIWALAILAIGIMLILA
ncbi:MAG: hypothetical protein WBC74_05145 [Candidatus Omnitrophota bacterium]